MVKKEIYLFMTTLEADFFGGVAVTSVSEKRSSDGDLQLNSSIQASSSNTISSSDALPLN